MRDGDVAVILLQPSLLRSFPVTLFRVGFYKLSTLLALAEHENVWKALQSVLLGVAPDRVSMKQNTMRHICVREFNLRNEKTTPQETHLTG